jgi:hypothetical protein
MMEQQQQGSPFLTGMQTPSEDDKLMGLLAHLGGILAPVIVPLVLMVTKGEKSPWVKAQAVEALNFQIIVMAGYVISTAVICLAWLLIPCVFLVAAVMGIMAGLKAKEGVQYRYPFNFRLIK